MLIYNNTVSKPRSFKTGAFDIPEILRFINFVDDEKYAHQFAMDKWLMENKFSAYVLNHGGVPRENMSSCSRMCVESVLFIQSVFGVHIDVICNK